MNVFCGYTFWMFLCAHLILVGIPLSNGGMVIDKALSHVCTFNLRQTENQRECGLPRITGGIQENPEPGPAVQAVFKPQIQLLPPKTLSRVLTPQLLLTSVSGRSYLLAFP